MEAKTNEPAYTALKRLDKNGVLRFELSYVIGPLLTHVVCRMLMHIRRSVVQELIKVFTYDQPGTLCADDLTI